jgi:hypothetical protein
LTLELLIAVLQLLDDAGQLPDLGFEAIDAHHQIGGRGRRRTIGGLARRRLRGALAAEPLAAAENPVE